LDNNTIVLLVVGCMIVAYQAFVSLLVKRCRFFTPSQRRLQYWLIWFVPMLGALICHAVVQSHGPQVMGNDSIVKHYEEADDYLVRSGGRPSRAGSDDGAHGDADGDG
jgi:hypothetical protein